MALSKLTESTVAKITEALTEDMSDADATEVSNIIEQALIGAVREITDQYRTVAVSTLGADADKAHKLAEEIQKAQIAIIANLQGLR